MSCYRNQKLPVDGRLHVTVVALLTLTLLPVLSGCEFFDSADAPQSLAGTVSLEDGTPVPGVDITISWAELEGKRVLVTNSAGRYRLDYSGWQSFFATTITPSHDSYRFSPTHYDLPPTSDNFSGLDFTATPLRPDAPS